MVTPGSCDTQHSTAHHGQGTWDTADRELDNSSFPSSAELIQPLCSCKNRSFWKAKERDSVLGESVGLLHSSQRRFGQRQTPSWLPRSGGSAQGAEPQSEEWKVPKSSLHSKSEAVALTHLKQADQRRHIIENGDSKIPFFSRNHCSLSAQDSEARVPFILAAALPPACQERWSRLALLWGAPQPCLLNFRWNLSAQGGRVFCLWCW